MPTAYRCVTVYSCSVLVSTQVWFIQQRRGRCVPPCSPHRWARRGGTTRVIGWRLGRGSPPDVKGEGLHQLRWSRLTCSCSTPTRWQREEPCGTATLATTCFQTGECLASHRMRSKGATQLTLHVVHTRTAAQCSLCIHRCRGCSPHM